MQILPKILLIFLLFIFGSCTTIQSNYSLLKDSFPARTEVDEILIYRAEGPDRQFIPVSRIDVHIERTFFVGSGLDDAVPALKEQARLSGADAIIDIQEKFSQVGETRIYHVTAKGIRFID